MRGAKQRRAECDQRKRDAGLVPVHEWVPEADKVQFKAFAAQLRRYYTELVKRLQ